MQSRRSPDDRARRAPVIGAPRKRAVLVGAGHAHLFALKNARSFAERGYELFLIAPRYFWYSGLATGMLGGHYPPELDRIDARSLVIGGGGRFIEDCVVRLDPSARKLHLAENEPVTYDVLSLNVGSETPSIEGEAQRSDRCYAVKPIHRLRALNEALTHRLGRQQRARTTPLRVLVVGAGVTAFELAANILGLAARVGGKVDLTLMTAGSEVLKQLPRSAARAVENAVVARGARVIRDQRAVRVADDVVETQCGASYAYDIFVNATGLQPGALVRQSGLPVTDDGAMLVDDHLRCTADPRIHGGGDMVALEGRGLPKVGVYAIREGPVLYRNLLAALQGTKPRRFVPQQTYLWIMNFGDGSGLAAWGPLWWRGRSAFWLKDRIDRRFLQAYSST